MHATTLFEVIIISLHTARRGAHWVCQCIPKPLAAYSQVLTQVHLQTLDLVWRRRKSRPAYKHQPWCAQDVTATYCGFESSPGVTILNVGRVNAAKQASALDMRSELKCNMRVLTLWLRTF